jgi:hypothetical protein
MPNPVPIPVGPLAITDADTAKAEAFVSAIAQVFQSGTIGGTNPFDITPPTVYPQSSNNSSTPLALATKEQQLFFRQLGIALFKTWDGNTSGGGGVSAGTANTFTGPCTFQEQVGDLVYVMSTGKTVRRADPTDYMKLPSVGMIVDKESTTLAVVQTSGIVQGAFNTLVPGRSYFVGLDAKPSLTPPAPGPGESLFHQPIGIALDVTVMLLIPSLNLTRVRGS